MPQIRYVAGFGTLREIGDQLRREAEHVGVARADRIIGLTDGGNGLEDCLLDRVCAGLGLEIFLILDFWHAAEHLHDFAALLYASHAAESERQAETWYHLLKHQGGEAVLKELQSLDLEGRSLEIHEAHRLLTG